MTHEQVLCISCASSGATCAAVRAASQAAPRPASTTQLSSRRVPASALRVTRLLVSSCSRIQLASASRSPSCSVSPIAWQGGTLERCPQSSGQGPPSVRSAWTGYADAPRFKMSPALPHRSCCTYKQQISSPCSVGVPTEGQKLMRRVQPSSAPRGNIEQRTPNPQVQTQSKASPTATKCDKTSPDVSLAPLCESWEKFAAIKHLPPTV